MRHLYTFFLLLYLQTSFAQFGIPDIIDSTNAAFITNIVITDLDNDNQNDIVVTYFTDSVRWYKNNNLTFTKMPLLISGLVFPLHIDVADVDGNGLKDVVVSERSSTANNKVHLLKNMGASWVPVLIDNNIVLTVEKSYFVDMDNDGDPDIISCHDLNIAVYYNNGSGTFTGRNNLAGNNEFYNLVVKDFNGDGFKDFITHTGNGTELYKANSTNTGYNKQLITGTIHNLLETADIDNDGDFDIFYPNNISLSEIDTYKNNGTGMFTVTQTTNLGTASTPNPPLKLVKINLDNFTDVIYRVPLLKGLYYRENDGAGNFMNQKLLDSVYNYTYMNAGDLNNDLKNDIVWFGVDANNKKYFGYTKNQLVVTAVRNILPQTMKLFPNPAGNQITITHSYNSANHQLKVTDCQGRIVYQSQRIPNQINISGWPVGIYFLHLSNHTYKIIKQ